MTHTHKKRWNKQSAVNADDKNADDITTGPSAKGK